MNRHIYIALLAAVPLCATAAPPQYAVIDLGAVSAPGAALVWNDRKQFEAGPTSWPTGASSCLGNPPTINVPTQFPGMAVGSVCQDDRVGHVAAKWTIGSTVTLTVLGMLPNARSGLNGDYAAALDFNNLGDIVGYSNSVYDTYYQPSHDVASHGFIYNNGNWTELLPIAGVNYDSVAEGINNSREVVGWTQTISSTTGQVLQRAFIYTGGTMYNPTFYLAGGPTVLLSDAYGIDCQGNIAATGSAASDGTPHNYLLVRQGTARTNCPL
jgi:probable HAF family extracellular repeat protein